jgi:endoglucanase
MKKTWGKTFLAAALAVAVAAGSIGCGSGKTKAVYEPETEVATETETEAVTETESEMGTEVVTGAEPDAKTEEVTETEAGTETETEAVTETASVAEESGSETASSESSNNSNDSNKESSKNSSSKSKETAKESTGTLATPSNSGALQVIGTQLCDKSGNAVQLRGISTHGLAWFPDYVNNALFAELREDWNVNVIRLAMYTDEYGGYCSGGNQDDLKKLVKNGVKYATDNDMYVIIDWHVLNDQNPNTYIDEAKSFFKEMSKTYASYDNVLYEICNEPNGGTTWSDIKKYAKEIIPVIRKNNKNAVIIVGTPNWSQYVDQAADDPISDYDNIMYALHFYAATHKDSLRNTMTAAIDKGLPVFVSEYGICDASGSGGIDETEANKWVSTMDSYGVSYVAWNLSNKDETSAIIKSSCSKTSGISESDLSDSGKWLYKMLTGGTTTTTKKNSSSDKKNSTSDNNSSSDKNNSSTDKNDSSTNSTNGTILKNKNVDISAVVSNSWESDGGTFYQYTLTIKNTSKKTSSGWKITVKFNEDITLQNSWNGQFSVSGSTLTITSEDYNGAIEPNGSVSDIGFIVSGSSNLKMK